MLTYYFKIEKLAPPLNQYAQLEEMLALRKLGASYLDLQIRYNVPKDTIVYLCRRFGLGGKMNPPIRGRTTRITLEIDNTEETINPGKTYAEYLQEERNRKWERLTKNQR